MSPPKRPADAIGTAGKPAERVHSMVKRGRAWAVHDPAGELVALVLYRKGAAEVVRRLEAGSKPEGVI